MAQRSGRPDLLPKSSVPGDDDVTGEVAGAVVPRPETPPLPADGVRTVSAILLSSSTRASAANEPSASTR